MLILARRKWWLVVVILLADFVVAPLILALQYDLFQVLLRLPYVEAGR